MKAGSYIAFAVISSTIIAGISFYAGIQYKTARVTTEIALADRDITETETPTIIELPQIEPSTEIGTIVHDECLYDRIDSLTLAIGDLEKTIEYLARPFTVEFKDSHAITKLYIDPIDKLVTRSVVMLPVTVSAPHRIERIYVPIETKVVRKGIAWYWDIRLYTGIFTAGYISYKIIDLNFWK